MRTTDQRKVAQRQLIRRMLAGRRKPLSYVSITVDQMRAVIGKGLKIYPFTESAIHPMLPVQGNFQGFLLREHVLYLSVNDYVHKPEQLWLVESIVGRNLLHEAISESEKLDNNFFEVLFNRVSAPFHLSSDGTWLIAYDDELTQADFGPLTEISLLDAVQRYGLAMVEQAKEKTAVRL